MSGNADSTVKMWDIRSGDLIRTLEGKFKHEVNFKSFYLFILIIHEINEYLVCRYIITIQWEVYNNIF